MVYISTVSYIDFKWNYNPSVVYTIACNTVSYIDFKWNYNRIFTINPCTLLLVTLILNGITTIPVSKDKMIDC